MRLRVLFRLRLGLVLLLAALLVCLPPQVRAASVIMLTGIPQLRQQHSLTCESSATSMATRGVISEAQLMAAMPRNPNPNLGFRGNPDGQQLGPDLTDYGVYAQPLHNALARFGYRSDVIYYGNNDQIAGYVGRGWPVVVWITWRLHPQTPRLAQHNGVQFILVPGEHAITIVGFTAHTLIANDPWDGTRVKYAWQRFDRAWGYFGNMALAVDPCPLPGDVQTISVQTLSSTDLQLTWPKVANASLYHVLVTRHLSTDKVVLQADVTTREIDISNPSPGARYDVSVQAANACGDVGGVAHLSVQLPRQIPTPTPTPTATLSVTATASPTGSATLPTDTPAPTSTPTASNPH